MSFFGYRDSIEKIILNITYGNSSILNILQLLVNAGVGKVKCYKSCIKLYTNVETHTIDITKITMDYKRYKKVYDILYI